MSDPFDEMISGISEEFDKELLAKRGSLAVTVAGIAGLVYQDAIAHGVPADLAKSFAAEYWSNEMTPVVFIQEDEDGDS